MNKAAIITGAVSLCLLLTALLTFLLPMPLVTGTTFIAGIILAFVALFLSAYPRGK